MDSKVLSVAKKIGVSFIFCFTKSPLKSKHFEERLVVMSYFLKILPKLRTVNFSAGLNTTLVYI